MWAKRVCKTVSAVAEYCMITSTSSSDVAVLNAMNYLFRSKLATTRVNWTTIVVIRLLIVHVVASTKARVLLQRLWMLALAM